MKLAPAGFPGGFVKRFLPRSLLGRSLLIILLPLLLLESVALEIFYGSHLELISRRLGDAVAGEVGLTLRLIDHTKSLAARRTEARLAARELGLGITFTPGARLGSLRSRKILGPMDNALTSALEARLSHPFTTDWVSERDWVVIHIQRPDDVVSVTVPRKRFYSTGIYVFLLWVAGTALLVFGVAAAFMRIQVRAIRRLAAAAEAFGVGREQGLIRPEGATEVRRAAVAFNRMAERIRRFLSQRTEMLAGISHDLRTPLTRLRLAVAMLPADPSTREDLAAMTADVEEMDRMIAGYLAFTRGEGAEQAQPIDLAAMLEEVANTARRTGASVVLDVPPSLTILLRPDAVRRAITNLLDNAARHGRRIVLTAATEGSSVLVTVDDDGPGIPSAEREAAFRPFASGVGGGTGLGLTIARDIVHAHGGEIRLEESPLGGLRARISLPQ